MAPIPPLEVHTEPAGACCTAFTVQVPGARVAQEIEEVVRAAGRKVRLPGFRPGKTPLSLLRRALGESIQQDIQEHLCEHVVADAVRQAGLRPLRILDLSPRSVEIQEGQAVTVRFQVETAPEVELPPWDEISMEARNSEVQPEQLEAALQDLARQHARFDEVPGYPLDAVHAAVCDLRFVRGAEEGPAAEGVRLSLGAPLYGADPAAYEAALSGAKAGDVRALAVQFLEGFSRPDWIGSQGEVRIAVRQVARPRPATPEEIAQDLRFPGPEPLRQHLAEQLRRENERRERERQVQELLDTVARMRPFALPARLHQDEVEAGARGYAERLEKQAGLPPEEARKRADQAREQIQLDAERRLRQFFLLRRVAEQEGIQVTAADLERAYRSLGDHHQVPAGAVQAFYAEQGLTGRLRGDILEAKVRARLGEIAAARAARRPVAVARTEGAE